MIIVSNFGWLIQVSFYFEIVFISFIFKIKYLIINLNILGKCLATLQHPDSQVNAMEISPDGQLLAACGYQHIRMFDVNNTKPNPVVNFEGVR